jgi:hypothetical protein
MYQIILGISKEKLAYEIEQHAADNTFVFTLTLDSDKSLLFLIKEQRLVRVNLFYY